MAAAITKGKTFASTETVTNDKLHALVDNATIANIDQTNMAANYGTVITSASQPSDTDALWLDTSGTKVLKYHDGSSWTAVSQSQLPLHYRKEMYCRQTGTTTMAVAVGVLEINGQTISKVAEETLTISTAGNWAGGVSLRAVSTTGYIGVDSSGNIKMHTTAPTHSNYGLTQTAGRKRYVSWSSTTYRVIGWFRMNATGSGELDTFGVSNMADGQVQNKVKRSSGSMISVTATAVKDDSIPQSGEVGNILTVGFLVTKSNARVQINCQGWAGAAGGSPFVVMTIHKDSDASALAADAVDFGGGNGMRPIPIKAETTLTEFTYAEFKYNVGEAAGGAVTVNGEGGARLLGGVIQTMIEVWEEERENG